MFMCVILLNLLIAVMSSLYEQALEDNFESKYAFRCEMICEATMIKSTFSYFLNQPRALIFNLSYSAM